MPAAKMVKTGPRDVFLHLLAIGTLYASAIAFSALIFQYINYWLPQFPAGQYYYASGVTSGMRYSLSVLIVVFPVYFLVSRMLRKLYEAAPARAGLPIRRWLSYFTIFLAAIISIGELVSVINTYLNGEFTTAFLLKALTIFFVTGSIFYYYRAVTHGEEARPGVRYYGYFAALIVLAAIVAVFFVVGSPQNQRLLMQDDQRVVDLQNIQSQVGEYFRAKQKMPAALTDLKSAFGESTVPADPTGRNYEYIPGEGYSFELCATFALPSSAPPSGLLQAPAKPAGPGGGVFGPATDNWQHASGRQCFARTLDPAYFAPFKP